MYVFRMQHEGIIYEKWKNITVYGHRIEEILNLIQGLDCLAIIITGIPNIFFFCIKLFHL